MMADFHFLRPWWFLALVPLGALVAAFWRRRLGRGRWQAVVDPPLLPHLLIGQSRRQRPWAIATLAVAGLLAVTALAGPAWSKLKEPVFRRASALVVLLDMSRSMNAADVSPSRLQMAKYKLQDLLNRRKEGDTALVLYAAEAYVVTPLTSDAANLTRILPNLAPDVMPAQGSRADRAIAKALDLLKQAGALDGHVLLVTDGVENTPQADLAQATQALIAAGHHLSVMGVGTPEGAPIPNPEGGFFQDEQGGIVLPKLDEAPLSRLALQGRGEYRRLSPDDRDTDAFAARFDRPTLAQKARELPGMKSDQWKEQGPWLLLPVLLLAALGFRRGALGAAGWILLLGVLLPLRAEAMTWADWWQTRDQQGAAALAHQDPARAAQLFADPKWRSVAHYRAGHYQAALDDLAGQKGAQAAYNRGNALAHLGKLPEALSAYEEALREDPGNQDARHNRDLIRKALQHQPQQPQQSPQNPQGNQSQQAPQGKNDPTSQKGSKDSPQQPGGAASAGPPGTPSPSPGARRKPPSPSPAPSGSSPQAARPAQREAQKGKSPSPPTRSSADEAKREADQATEQLLRSVPDDPGGLWRRKFEAQYRRERGERPREAKPW